MFTLFLDWLKPFITGFATAWSWLITPILQIPALTYSYYGGVFNFSVPAWSVTPISVISIGGFATLFIFGLAKTVLDALPVV